MWNPFKKKKGIEEFGLTVSRKEQSLVPVNQEAETCEILQPVSDSENALIIDSNVSMSQEVKAAEMGVGLARHALDVYNTSLMVEQNIATIRAASEVQLAQIATKFEFCKSALEHVFQDRHSALAAHYCVLNDAMKSNDREMILVALRGISSIVVTSPLKDFTEIVSNWDSYSKKKPLELDF